MQLSFDRVNLICSPARYVTLPTTRDVVIQLAALRSYVD
jgi:hypothetical protein